MEFEDESPFAPSPDREGSEPTMTVYRRRIMRWLREEPDDPRAKPTDAEIARRAGVSKTTYRAHATQGPDHRPPSTMQLARLSDVGEVPLGALFDPENDPRIHERHGVRWRLGGDLGDSQVQALRVAAHRLMYGASPEECLKAICRIRNAEGRGLPPWEEAEVRWMAGKALSLGFVELSHAYRYYPDHRAFSDPSLDPRQDQVLESFQNRELAGVLGKELTALVPGGAQLDVYVVRNLADDRFALDPVAPHLIARVGHHVVRHFFARDRNCHYVGLGGGSHVAAFVRSVGGASSPFPDSFGTGRRYQIHPLTREPQPDHRLGLARDLVAELQHRAGALVGPLLVEAPTNREVYGDPHVLGADLASPGKLEVAIFGCGDQEDGGWLRFVVEALDVKPAPATDVALNMLTADGERIQLDSSQSHRLGVGLPEIQRVARGGLALLVTSGPNKGLPLIAVARARAANTIVCDERAANAALEAIRNA